MAQATYRLAVQTGSAAHFALVQVVVEQASRTMVEVSCPSDMIRGWRAAATTGVESALRSLLERSMLGSSTKATIVRFIGTPTDTDDDDAFAASYMATVRAVLGPDAPVALVQNVNGSRWSIDWIDSTEGTTET